MVDAWWKVWKKTPDDRVGHKRMMEQKNEWLKRGGSWIERSKDACRRHGRVGIGELMRCMDNKYKVISIPRLVFQF
jgi:hypothetical protein